MTSLRDYSGALTTKPELSSCPVARPKLDQAALANGAAERRQRLLDIDAEIDSACEIAASRCHTKAGRADCHAWDAAAWGRYVNEAARQAQARGIELRMLSRQAEQLERLIAIQDRQQ